MYVTSAGHPLSNWQLTFSRYPRKQRCLASIWHLLRDTRAQAWDTDECQHQALAVRQSRKVRISQLFHYYAIWRPIHNTPSSQSYYYALSVPWPDHSFVHLHNWIHPLGRIGDYRRCNISSSSAEAGRKDCVRLQRCAYYNGSSTSLWYRVTEPAHMTTDKYPSRNIIPYIPSGPTFTT